MIYLRRFSLFFLAIVAACIAATAAPDRDYMVKSLDVSDGLSQNTITAILRDSHGFLWIGTRQGLNRYDYNSLRQFYANQSKGQMTDDDVVALFEDANGGIWVMTQDGTSRYDHATETFRKFAKEDGRFCTLGVLSLDDGLLFGSKGGEMVKYSYATDTIEVVAKGFPNDRIDRMYRRPDGTVMLVTKANGIWIYDPATGKGHHTNIDDSEFIPASTFDSHGNIWLSPFGHGVRCYGPDGKLKRTFTSADGLSCDIVTDMIATSNSVLVATEHGLNVIDIATGHVDSSPFNGVVNRLGAIKRLYIDNNENVYIGTVRNGLKLLQNVTMRTFKLNPPDVMETSVTSFLSGKNGELWCGVDGNGVMAYSPATGQWDHIASTDHRKVVGLANWPGDKVLVSTYGERLMLLDRRTQRLEPAPAFVNQVTDVMKHRVLGVTLYNLPDGRIAAMSDTVYVIDPEHHNVVKTTTEPGTRIGGKLFSFYTGPGEMLLWWYRNIYRFDLATMKISQLATTPNEQTVRGAQFDGRETIYMATADLIFTYNIHTGLVDQMPLDAIHNISTLVLDGRKLWIGAANRLFMNDGDRRFAFDEGDGVVPNEFLQSSVYVDSVYVYMGGTNGITRINRRETELQAASRPRDVNINLAELTLNGPSCMAQLRDGHLRIPARDATVAFKVINNEANQLRSKVYRYYLDGLGSDEPYETLSPTLSISELPAGKSIPVRVSCTLPDGSWSEPKLLFVIDVEPLWWQSWWFMALLVIAAGLVVYGIYRLVRQRWATASDTHHRRMLERDVQILANINESLRAPLRRLADPIHKALEALDHDKSIDKATLSSRLEDAVASIDTMQAMVDSPFEMLHPQSLSVDSIELSARFNVWLSKQLDDFARAQRINARVTVDFRPDCDPGIITFNASRMEMIVSCLLTDLVWRDPTRLSAVIGETTGDDTDGEEGEASVPAGSLKVTFAVAGATADSERSTESEPNLRMLYAKWLAEAEGIKVTTRFDAEGHLVEAAMIFNPVKGHRSAAVSGAEESDLPDPETLIASMDLVVADSDDRLTALLHDKYTPYFHSVTVADISRPDHVMSVVGEMRGAIVALEGTSAGLDLCRRIKQQAAADGREIAVVLLTSGNLAALKMRGAASGADAYLEKPFDVGVLLSLCRQIALELRQ